MKLDRQQLGDIIHNVMSYEFDAQGTLHFKRFTESQLAAYKEESEGWYVRANASAGVTFDFISDSNYIALKMDLKEGSAQFWTSFDLHVDGIFTDTQAFSHLEQKLLSFSLPEGEHRITLYFPWTAETLVREVHLSDGATITPVTKRAKGIVFGDSITHGSVTQYTSLSYANQVASKTNVELINQGVGGYYFGARTIDESLISYRPDFILIAYGTNDYSRCETIEDFRNTVESYLEKLNQLFPETKKVAVLPIFRNDLNNQTREKYRSYSFEDSKQVLLDIYARYDTIHVLEETGMPHIPGVFVTDYLHPNELGFTFMAQTISEELKKLL